jgi:CDP-diacylglycerol--glycerol-3-phosphate 3-phosphatidyltransferase
MTLANWITTSRIILAPLCVGILFWDIPGRDLLAAIIFIIAGLTDGLDGYAARLRKETSTFGKSFDPFADKVLIILTLVVLANLHRVSWVAVWIIITREVLITILRYFAGKKGLSVSASPWGKLKTFSQIVAVSFIMLERIWQIAFSQWLLWIAVILTVISGLDYVWRWKGAFGPTRRSSLVVRRSEEQKQK